MPWQKLNHLSEVPRWTIVPTIRKQSVAEHSFHVAWLALWLGSRLPQSIREAMGTDLLEYALRHDEFEAVTGDTPTTAKRQGVITVNDPGINASVFAKTTVKLADYLEAYRFMEKERLLGNVMIAERMQLDLIEALKEWGKKHHPLTPNDYGVEEFFHLYDVTINHTPVMGLPGMGD